MRVDRDWICDGFEHATRRLGSAGRRRAPWSAEWAIPFASLGVATPVSGARWRANFFRADHSGGGHYAAWSPTFADPPDFHLPDRFGELVFDVTRYPGRGALRAMEGISMKVRSLALLAALVIATPSAAGVITTTLDRFSLVALQGSGGWSLETDAEGSDLLTSVTVTPPGKPSIAFACAEDGPGVVVCQYDSGVPVGSFAALLVDFPAGTWLLTVNGTLDAELLYDPVEPDGTVTVTSPADGAVNVGAMPSVSYTHDCANCNFVLLRVDSEEGGGGLEALIAGDPPASPGTILYADFTSPDGMKPAMLADGVYELAAGSITGIISDAKLEPGTAQSRASSTRVVSIAKC